MIARRGFIAGLAAALAAPAIIRTPGLLMRVKALKPEVNLLTGGEIRYGAFGFCWADVPEAATELTEESLRVAAETIGGIRADFESRIDWERTLADARAFYSYPPSGPVFFRTLPA